MKIDRILMPTDFSDCSRQALDHALFLARQFGAELHFLHVVTLHGEYLRPDAVQQVFPDENELIEHLHKVSEIAMKKLTDGREPLRIHEHIRRGIAAAPEIEALARERSVDVIVMGAHGRRGVRRLLLGSVAEETVRIAPCPVLTLRQSDEEIEVRSPERILVPIDFSEPARQALRTALDLAEFYGGKLEIVHVVEQPIYPIVYEGFYSPLPTDNYPEMRKSLEKHLDHFVETACAGSSVPLSIHLLDGSPAQEICAYIQTERPDLTVIATHGLTGLEHLLLGSVAERVVRSAEGPVLTVKGDTDDGEAASGAIDVKNLAVA